MKTEEIIAFVNNNEKEDVKAYLDRLIDNIKEVTSMYFRYFLFLMFIVFLHFMLKNSFIDEIQIGVVKISNLYFVDLIIPLLYSVIYLTFSMSEHRKSSLMFQAKVIQNMTHNYEMGEDDFNRNNYNGFNLSYLPFSFTDELLLALNPKRGFDIIAILLFILIALPFAVFLLVFNFTLLLEMSHFWCDSFLIKSLIIGTWGLYTFSLFFFIKIGIDKNKYEKEDKEFWETVRKENDSK